MSYLQSVNQKVIEVTPKTLSRISKYTPAAILKPVFKTLLNQLFKQQLADGELDFLKTKWVRISITDIHLSIDISLATAATAKTSTAPELLIDIHRKKIDVVFSSQSDYLLLIALHKVDPDTLFFQRKLSIEGDTDLGLFVKNFLAGVDLTDHLPRKLSGWIDQLADDVYQKHH